MEQLLYFCEFSLSAFHYKRIFFCNYKINYLSPVTLAANVKRHNCERHSRDSFKYASKALSFFARAADLRWFLSLEFSACWTNSCDKIFLNILTNHREPTSNRSICSFYGNVYRPRYVVYNYQIVHPKVYEMSL
jgi:hypothetical protein